MSNENKPHFGTDGIRGRANEVLNADMAYGIGRYIGYYYSSLIKDRAKIAIGKDTRISSNMFEAALAAGITASGADAYLIGYCPTPCTVYLTRIGDFSCGVMISASHNPYYDNGIKIISGAGTKMDAGVEKDIEDYIYGGQPLAFATGAKIGQTVDYSQGLQLYLDHIKEILPLDLSGMHVVLDTDNGSATYTAPLVFKAFNADVEVINDKPDGLNINTNCGSTHLDMLVDYVKKGHYDAGFAFDGDADRLMAVASDGTIVDGDKIIYCCGRYLASQNQLRNNTVVTTVMANLGFFKKMEACHIKAVSTRVGDKYVYESMCANDYVIGGEQSGHIIFKDLETTGDGLVTALMLMKVIQQTGQTLNQLTDDLKVYPQLLVNVPVKDKETIMNQPALLEECEKVKAALGSDGRVLVRTSGTEPLLRVMVEAASDELCHKYVYQIVDLIKNQQW